MKSGCWFLWSLTALCLISNVSTCYSQVDAVNNERRLFQIRREVDEISLKMNGLILQLTEATSEDERYRVRTEIRVLGERLRDLENEITSYSELRGPNKSEGLFGSIRKKIGL